LLISLIYLDLSALTRVGREPIAALQKLKGASAKPTTGMAILGLTFIGFIVRLATAKPADATTGHAALDRSTRLAHYGFYLLVVLMAGTGLATAILAGLNRSVFQKTGEALPATFDAYPTFRRIFSSHLF
jgi:cytochrome b561